MLECQRHSEAGSHDNHRSTHTHSAVSHLHLVPTLPHRLASQAGGVSEKVSQTCQCAEGCISPAAKGEVLCLFCQRLGHYSKAQYEIVRNQQMAIRAQRKGE